MFAVAATADDVVNLVDRAEVVATLKLLVVATSADDIVEVVEIAVIAAELDKAGAAYCPMPYLPT